MADKGLLESARRMYGAKDAARQEAKKDMARSGEILYRGLRDFGLAKQREDTIKRSEAARREAIDYRKQTFDQTMDFRQRQFDYTKELNDQKIQESRYLEELGSAAKVADAINGIENVDFFSGMSATVEQYYGKFSGLNEQKHNRSGDPKAIANEYSKTATEFSNIAAEYKVMTDIINTVTRENPESGQMDLSIFSNEPGSQEALKNITTIIKGMRDKSIDMFGQDGKVMVRGDFNEDGEATVTPLSKLNLQEYILKNNNKAPVLDALFTNAYENGMKGFAADASLIASQVMNSLRDNDDKAAYDDFDPDFDGATKTDFKSYHIPDLKNGTIEQGINPRWGNAQNQWWNYQIESQGWTQVDNVNRDGVAETSWTDNDENVYTRRTFDENQGISSWTKNGKRHYWHHDDAWSGDNGIGISRKGLFAEWLGDIYAEGVNSNEGVKEQIARKNIPGKGTDLGIANARNHIVRLAQGIEKGDYRILSGLLNEEAYRTIGDKAVYSTVSTTLDDGSTVSNINLREGQSMLPHSATNYTKLSSKDQKMEMLNNIIDEHFGGSDLRTVLNEEGTSDMINQVFTDEKIETPGGGDGQGPASELLQKEFNATVSKAIGERNIIDKKIKELINHKTNDGDAWDYKWLYDDATEFIKEKGDDISNGLALMVIPEDTDPGVRASIESEVENQITLMKRDEKNIFEPAFTFTTTQSDTPRKSGLGYQEKDVRKILTYIEYIRRTKK